MVGLLTALLAGPVSSYSSLLEAFTWATALYNSFHVTVVTVAAGTSAGTMLAGLVLGVPGIALFAGGYWVAGRRNRGATEGATVAIGYVGAILLVSLATGSWYYGPSVNPALVVLAGGLLSTVTGGLGGLVNGLASDRRTADERDRSREPASTGPPFQNSPSRGAYPRSGGPRGSESRETDRDDDEAFSGASRSEETERQ